MRTFTTIFAFLFTVSLLAQGPKRGNKRFEGFSAKQQATLMTKRMTLALDLNKAQQKKVASLIEDQVAFRKEAAATRASHRTSESKPTAKERFEFQEKQLDHQIAFKKSMKEILDESQFEKFEKMHQRRQMRAKQRGQRAMRGFRGQNRQGPGKGQRGPEGRKGNW